MMLLRRKNHGIVELCAFKQRLSILYYLLSVQQGDEDKLAIWCRLVQMARRHIDIDALVAFRTLKLMTEPQPPPESTKDIDDEQSQGHDQRLGQTQGQEAEAAAVTTAAVPKINTTWKRVHACNFEIVVKSQLASNICNDAKVIHSFIHSLIYSFIQSFV